MIYKASLDKITKAITIGTTVLFIAVLLWLFLKKEEWYTIVIFAIIILLIYTGIFLYRPLSYELTADRLIVHRLVSNVGIERNKISGVEQVPNEQIAWSFRTFGVGGLFGYFGKFINRRMGHMTWYATRKRNAVLISTTDARKIILTPDEPGAFVAAFNYSTNAGL